MFSPIAFSKNALTRWFRKTNRPVQKDHPTATLDVEQLEERWLPSVLTPTTFADGLGNGTLRHDILLADTNGQNNTIQLSAGTYNLSVAGNDSTGTAGNLLLDASGFTETIQGAGAGKTFINANSIDRVFQVLGNVNVVFSNLTITGGLATDGGSLGGSAALGGGILNNGGSVTLDHVGVINNVAQGAPGQDAFGGGIYSNGTSLTISDSTISLNRAVGGDGVSGSDGGTGQSGTDGGKGGDARGGGIYVAGGTLVINRSTIDHNQAKAGKGGHGGHGGNGATSTSGGGTSNVGGGTSNPGCGGSTNVGGGTSCPGGGTSNPGGGTSNPGGGGFTNPGGGTSNPAGGNSNPAGGTSNPGGNTNPGGGGYSNPGGGGYSNPGSGGYSNPGGYTGGGGGYSGGGYSGGGYSGGGSFGSDVAFAAVNQSAMKPAGMVASNMNVVNPGNGGFGGLGGNAQGGGLFIANGMVSVTNSTFANNSTLGGNGGDGGDPGVGQGTAIGGNGGDGGLSQGGGLFLSLGSLDLTNDTIAYNMAIGTVGGAPGAGGTSGAGQISEGGGVANTGGTVDSLNSLYAGNSADFAPDFWGNFAAANNNLVSDGTGSNLAPAFPDASGNLVGSNSSPINADIGTLQNNGGPTQTIALLTGSPAINAGDPNGAPSTDQRGVLRDASPDIGAYEFQGFTATSLNSSAPTTTTGQAVKFTATVTDPAGGTPTGYVTFMDGNTDLGTAPLAGNTATFTTSSLSIGSHSITADYSGDSNFATSNSSAVTETINPTPTTTSLSETANSVAYGHTATFTATVSATGQTPTGSVTFMDGSNTLGTVTLSSGKATFSTTSLSLGSHNITAVYGGNGNVAGSTSTVKTETVTTAPTTTTDLSSAPTTSLDQPVTFTATVNGTTTIPTGNVTFKDGSTTLATVALVNGSASFGTSSLAIGGHSITAVYSGDVDYNASTSATLTETITKAATTTTLMPAVPISFGQLATFTATVNGINGVPVTGTVTFKDGSTTLGTVNLTNGSATFSTSSLAVGAHAITATYSGNSNYNSSVSTLLGETVNWAPSTISLALAANSLNYGSSAKFTATVTGSVSGVAATGVVTFMDGSTVIGVASIASGKATFSTTSLLAGSHSITAVYGGNMDYFGSTSAILTENVNQAATTTSLTTSAGSIALGKSVTFTATVSKTGIAATGTVTFMDGLNLLGTATLSAGKATFSTSSLAVGSHTITAVYGGDSNYIGSTSGKITETITRATAPISLSPLSPASFGQAVTYMATITGVNGIAPTGTVTFRNGSTVLGTVGIVGGTAIFSTSSLSVGGHSITAVYSGDGDYNSSTSPALTQTITRAASTTTLSPTNPASAGQMVTFTATLNEVNGVLPTGLVYFKDGTTTLGSASLSNGIATFSTKNLSSGSHTITAVYVGNSNYLTSTSSPVTQVIL